MQYRHYGWDSSPYSAKSRAALHYKGVVFEDVHPTVLTMYRVIQRRLGFVVLPVLRDRGGELIQDTTDIIDHLERTHPYPPVLPKTPRQRLVALLLEVHGDEWLPLIAMHWRWSFLKQNDRYIRSEFGREAAPWLPRIVQRRIGKVIAKKMSGYLPVLGINDTTKPAIEAWTIELLNALETHLTEHPYLLGTRPCTGDFSLYGPIYAHLFRDPASTQLVTSRPHLLAWMERLRDGAEPDGEWIPNDEVPVTLYPVLKRMFTDQFPVLAETTDRVATWLDSHPEATSVPRGMGKVSFKIGDAVGERTAMSIQQWMVQRPLAYYNALDSTQRGPVDVLLREVGGYEAMQLDIRRRIERRNYRLAPAQ